MVNANLKEKMLRFQIPNELKDDLVYCQRSLRQFVKVHQLLASKLSNGLTQSQITKLKRYLHELEAEMIEIGNEQRPLVQELDQLIFAYLRHLSTHELVNVDPETAQGYVSRALSVHYEMSFNTKYTPRNVTERLSEAQLVHKYELSSFDEARPKKEKDESQSSIGSASVSPTVPFSQKQQVSLLKPKEERFTGNGSSGSRLANEQALKKIAPETIAVPKRLVKSLPKSESLPRPIPKMAEVVVVNEKPSPVKQEQQDDEDQEDGDGEDDLPELPPTVAIKKSRLNLLQALTKARNQNQNAPEDAPKTVPNSPRQRATMTKVKSDPLPKRTSSGNVSSDSSPNSRSSTPLSGKASDDSSERDRSPIEEYVEPQPTNIAELPQPIFLRYFGLLTLDESKVLATRKTERKRRSCNSTERKDFHYGKIDYYEQQLSHIARRRNKRPILYSPPATRGVKKRKHFELIADRTGAGKVGGGGGSSASSTSSSGVSGPAARVGMTPIEGSSSKLVLTDLDNKMCIVCNKAGSADSLSACVYCCNIYHLKCHSNSIFNPQLLRQRDNICPVCLQKKQQATLALQNQQRDELQRKRLLRRNEEQRARHETLQMRKRALEGKFALKQRIRKRLLAQERDTRDQIANLMNSVRTLRHEQ